MADEREAGKGARDPPLWRNAKPSDSLVLCFWPWRPNHQRFLLEGTSHVSWERSPLRLLALGVWNILQKQAGCLPGRAQGERQRAAGCCGFEIQAVGKSSAPAISAPDPLSPLLFGRHPPKSSEMWEEVGRRGQGRGQRAEGEVPEQSKGSIYPSGLT